MPEDPQKPDPSTGTGSTSTGTEPSTDPDEAGLETQIEMDEVGPCKRILKISVPVEKVQEQIEKSYGELGSNLVYPGFRKGHVPRQLLQKRFGSQIMDEVKESLLQSTYEEAVSEKKLHPLGEPTFEKTEFDADKPFSYEVTLDVRPEFDLGEYKGIKVDEPAATPTEEQIETALKNIRRSRAELVTADDGVAREGDYLIADIGFYVGEEKVQFEEEASVPVGMDALFGLKDPKIRDLFLGARVGEPKEAEVAIPDSFPKEEYRGKTARLTADPKEVKRVRLPDLNEGLAKDLGFSSVDDLKEDVVRRLKSRGEAEKKIIIENRILKKIIEAHDLPLPEEIVEKEADNVETRRRWRLQQAGADEEEIEKVLSEERSRSKEEIAHSLREIFILDKIADKEKMYISEEEVDRRLSAHASAYGKSLQVLKDELRGSRQLGVLRTEMRHESVRAYLREQAQIIPAPAAAPGEKPAKKAGPAKKPAKKAAAPKKSGSPKKAPSAKKGGRGGKKPPKAKD